MRFRERLARMLQGRNGSDELARFCNGVGFGLVLLALVFTVIGSALTGAASIVFRVLYWVTYACGAALLGYSLFRIFSRNVGRRQTENTRHIYRMNKLRRKWEGLLDRWKNRKEYRYLRCPKCRQQLRVPRNKGKIRVTCSKCGEKFIIQS